MGLKRTWDADEARELLAAGKSHCEVAKAVGCSVSALRGMIYQKKKPKQKDEVKVSAHPKLIPKPKESIEQVSRKARELGMTYGELTKLAVTVTVPPGLKKVGVPKGIN